MENQDLKKSWRIMWINTVAFTICFAVWFLYAVLIKFFNKTGLYEWDNFQVGLLIAIPVLSGSLLRFPVGLLTDKYGGRPVYTAVLLLSSLGVFMVSLADGYVSFLIAGLCLGISGASFAVGIAYTSIWFPKEKQGLALGVFGAGNAGAAITLLGAPRLLNFLTDGGANLEGWRSLPLVYAGVTVLTAIVFWIMSENRVPEESATKTFKQRLAPLKQIQVWRFGYYYFFVFGCFVGLSNWLVKYYVDVYDVTLATAGILAAVFSLPSGVIRAAGGWLSDTSGARVVMYYVLGISAVSCVALCFSLPIAVFTLLAFIVGIAMGIGKAAVYKHIPVYFPKEVGVVGGIVGVLGGLGGFICPIVFGWLLNMTKTPSLPQGSYPSCWLFLSFVSISGLVWMHLAVKKHKRVELQRLQMTQKAA